MTDENKKYLTDKLGWTETSANRVTGSLAKVLVQADQSGLEGAALPVILNLNATSTLRLKNNLSSIKGPQDAFRTLSLFQERFINEVGNHLVKSGRDIKRKLILTGAVSSFLNTDEIRSILEMPSDSVKSVELDSPGALELNIACPFIGLTDATRHNGLDGRGIIVAVLDGEVTHHPALNGRLEFKANFSSTPFGTSPDDAGEAFSQTHATAVATIIAGNGVSSTGQTQYLGVSPAAVIWNYKISPSTATGSDVIAALEQAYLDGAKIINLSWGKSDVELDGSSNWSRTVDALFEQGVLVCKSVGNKGPAASSLTVPADAKNVLSIGAVDVSNANIHEGSSSGPTSDGRDKPELVAPGGGTVAGSNDGLFIGTRPPGTSFASPFVAGIAALLWQRKPTATVMEIRNVILSSCARLPGSPNELQGAGVPSILKALELLN